MDKVVIDRAKWRTGRYGDGNRGARGVGFSQLLNVYGYRCCLGFLGKACGFSDADLVDCGDTCNVDSYAAAGEWPSALYLRAPYQHPTMHARRDWESVLIALNDFEDIDDATRESWIAEGFRTVLGVDVEFTGSYPTEAQ